MAQNRERGERLQIMLAGEELAALDDFRFKNRMPSVRRRSARSCDAGWASPVSKERVPDRSPAIMASWLLSPTAGRKGPVPEALLSLH